MSALQDLTRRFRRVPSVLPNSRQDPNQRPEAHRHLYRPGITDQNRWAKHYIATSDGHAR